MITKSDWQSVHQQLVAEQRQKFGEPPTAEEALAYSRGELSPDEEAHMRERLLSHPELLRTLAAEFPAEGAEPGDSDYMTDGELAIHWNSLQKRRSARGERGRVVQFWRISTALAAAIALALGVMLWQSTQRVAQPSVVWEQQVLFPDGHRGGGSAPTELAARGDTVLLVIPLISEGTHSQYRIEINGAGNGRTVWNSGPLAPREDQTFSILVPRRFLEPGDYQVVMIGISGAAEERLATYSLRVPAARS
jgi:hypothetical protein